MPEWLIPVMDKLGALSVLVAVIVYLLLTFRRSSNPGNPGPPLINGRWQEQMKAGQDTTNATLGRIEEGIEESVKLLRLMEDWQQRERGG